MAKTNVVALCPGCKNELDHPIPEKCPSCGKHLGKTDNPYFENVDYFVLQYAEHKDKLLIGGSSEKQPTKKDKDEWVKVQNEFDKWLRLLPFEEKMYCFQDCELLMRHILFGKHSGAEFKALVSIAKKIGEQGAAIEKYFAAGGERYDKEIRPVPAKQGDISIS